MRKISTPKTCGILYMGITVHDRHIAYRICVPAGMVVVWSCAIDTTHIMARVRVVDLCGRHVVSV